LTDNPQVKEVESEEISIEALGAAYDERLKRFYTRTLIAFALCFFSTAGTLLYVFRQGDENRTSLCALRLEAENRVAQGEQFLKDNPQGIPGITPQMIQRSLETSRTTISALSNLNCEYQANKTSPPTATEGTN